MELYCATENPEVGPADNGSYYYRVCGFISEHAYHNSASARHDGQRIQRVNEHGRIEPFNG